MKKIILSFGLVAVFLISVFVANAALYESPVLKVALLNQDPDPAQSGDTVDARLRIENTGGGVIKDLQVEALQNYPFTVVNGPSLQNLGTLYAYQTDKNYINTEFELKIDKDVINGNHELKVRYKHDNEDWTIATFYIKVASKQMAQIIVDKAKINPGEETDLKFTIANNGNSALQNLIFSWKEANGVVLPVYSDDTKYIRYLDIGQSIDLDYKVIADVNAKPGLYKLDLTLKYESLQNTTLSTTSTSAGIFIGGETDFDVAFSQSSQGQTSLSVANTGNNPAQSVSVRIPEQPAFRVSGSNSAIIGNLDKGDYTVVSFQIVQGTLGNFTGSQQRAASQRQTRQSAPVAQNSANSQDNAAALAGKNNNLKVTIDYTDTTGERKSVEKNVSIQFRTDTAAGANAASVQSSFFTSWTFYILVIAAIIGFYYRKRIADLISKNKKN